MKLRLKLSVLYSISRLTKQVKSTSSISFFCPSFLHLLIIEHYLYGVPNVPQNSLNLQNQEAGIQQGSLKRGKY